MAPAVDEQSLLDLINVCFGEGREDGPELGPLLLPPNPFLTNDQQLRDEPAWRQLEW